eukprot:scaffold76138_cov53-Attheya_sp.AAC.2
MDTNVQEYVHNVLINEGLTKLFVLGMKRIIAARGACLMRLKSSLAKFRSLGSRLARLMTCDSTMVFNNPGGAIILLRLLLIEMLFSSLECGRPLHGLEQ